MPTATKKTTKTDFSGIRVGDRMSMTYYLRVNNVNKVAGSVDVTDQNGNNFTIVGKSLIENTIDSAGQYTNTVKITRTEMVDKLESAGDAVFTVNFDKQDNTNRTLIGHLVSSEPKMGRSNVVDLEVTTGHNGRQVDHRTLNWLILKGTRYTVK